MDTKCQRCEGCGQIANSDDGEAWVHWESLPPGSDLAVRSGLVSPIPCPRCDGSGEEPTEDEDHPSDADDDPMVRDLLNHLKLSVADHEQLASWFTYHPPTPEQIPFYESLRAEARTFAQSIAAACPAGVERDRALAALREAVMWANAGIACGGGS